MEASVYILSRVDRVSSQHVRELISKCKDTGVRIYTDSVSSLVIKECLALGIYPSIVPYNSKFKLQVHLFVANGDCRVKEKESLYESLGDRFNMHFI